MIKTFSVTRFFAVFVAVACIQNSHVLAQNCGCGTELCCSKWGYCGTTADYCGDGCKSGPCYATKPTTSNTTVPVPNVVSSIVSNLVTDSDEFFNGIIDQAATHCPGKSFYSRSSFLAAFSSFPEFGIAGSTDASKREIAAFFAHLTHETGYFCYIEEINGTSKDYCDKTNTKWPCNPKQKYYGRGPMQITWNFNYGPAGQAIGFDGENAPDTVAKDPVIAFKTAFWFWMNNVHPIILSGHGFGATIKVIGGYECNGGNPAQVSSRVGFYRQYCDQFGVSPGNNLSC